MNELARRIGLERPHMIEAERPRDGICPELPRGFTTLSGVHGVEWLPHGLGPHPATREEAPAGGGIAVGALGIASYRALLERRPPSGRGLPGEIFLKPGVVVWDFGPDGLLHVTNRI